MLRFGIRHYANKAGYCIKPIQSHPLVHQSELTSSSLNSAQHSYITISFILITSPGDNHYNS